MQRVGPFIARHMQKTLYTRQYQVLLTMLREARDASGTFQADIAKQLEISQSVVSKCELGQRRIDVVELKLWLDVLGVGLIEFLSEFEARTASSLEASSRKKRRI